MIIYSFPAIVAFVINFTVAFAVFFGNTRSSANRWISAFVLGLAVWNLSEIFVLASGSQQGATFAAQILYRAIFITPAIYLVAAYHFPQGESSSTRGPVFNLVVFLIPVLLLLSSFLHFHIRLIPLSDSGAVYYYRLVIRPDFQSVSLLSTFFVYLFWGSIVMIRKISTLRTTNQKHRARLFLLGGTIFLVSSLMLFIVEMFAENTLIFYAASTLLSSVVSGFFAIAVLGGRMFKSPRAIRSSVAYSVASSIILTVYFLSVEAVTQGLLNYFRISSYAANALFVLGLVLLIRPLEQRIYGTLDRLLNRDVRRYRHSMVTLSRELSNYLSVGDLFRRVEVFLSRQFQIQQVFVLIRNEKSLDQSRRHSFSDWKQQPDCLTIEQDCQLVHRLLETRRAIEFYDIERECDRTLCSQLESKSIRILVPLFAEDDLVGILAIGMKKSGRELTADTLDALTIFANEVATAYHRNSTIEHMREKERQEFRTQHLASLGQLTAGVAHEIRNPLGVISMSAQTLLKKELNKKEESELKQFIVDEADRLNKILTDFLRLSKLREPKYETVALDEMLERLQAAITPAASDIDIRVLSDSTARTVLTDPELLYQLLFNLGINAVDAIKERCKVDPDFSVSRGTVTFATDEQGGRLNISVSDNGTGIPEEHLQKVFEPFYTTKEAGTGLGLSISHNIAETLGGHLHASSGKGQTIFTFTCELTKEKD
jgi:signal transduction histidine kinase